MPEQNQPRNRLSRREFLELIGLGALGFTVIPVITSLCNNYFEYRHKRKVERILRENLEIIQRRETSGLVIKPGLDGILALNEFAKEGQKSVEIIPDWQETGEIAFLDSKGNRVIIGKFSPGLSSNKESFNVYEDKTFLGINMISEKRETFERRAKEFMTQFKELNLKKPISVVNVADTIPGEDEEWIQKMKDYACLSNYVAASQEQRVGAKNSTLKFDLGNLIFIKQEMLDNIRNPKLYLISSPSGRAYYEVMGETELVEKVGAHNYSTLLLSGDLVNRKKLVIGTLYIDFLASDIDRLKALLDLAEAIGKIARKEGLSGDQMLVVLLGDTNPNGLNLNRSRNLNPELIREAFNLLGNRLAQEVAWTDEAQVQEDIFSGLNLLGLRIENFGPTLSTLKEEPLPKPSIRKPKAFIKQKLKSAMRAAYKAAMWAIDLDAIRAMTNVGKLQSELTDEFNKASDHRVALVSANFNQRKQENENPNSKSEKDPIKIKDPQKALEYFQYKKDFVVMISAFLSLTAGFLIGTSGLKLKEWRDSKQNSTNISTQEQIPPPKNNGNNGGNNFML